MANQNLIITFSNQGQSSNTISYARVDNTNTPVYTTLTGVTTSPLIIQNVPDGQYNIIITPVYADGRVCGSTNYNTPACTGIISFSAILSSGNIYIVYTANVSLPFIQVNINYPNGGSFSQQYASAGSGNISIPAPAGVYGNFSVTLQPVCDQTSGFLGLATAPAIVTIPPPFNSTITNNTIGPLAPVGITTFSPGGPSLIFTDANLTTSPATAMFFIADGNYTSIVVNYGSGTVVSASLTTGSGVYTGVLSAGTVTFTNVISAGGIAISIH
jgi:hypothetical protein